MNALSRRESSRRLAEIGCRTVAVAVCTMLCAAVFLTMSTVEAADPPKPAAEAAKSPAAKQPAARADKDGWTSLFDGKSLKGWEPAKFGGEGKVTVADGTIIMDRGDMMTGIKSTGKPAKMDYELALEGKRVDGNDFFCTTTFPVGDSFCSFVVGGWSGSVVGLSCIDYNDAANNSTMRTFNFKKDQWYAVRIRVTKDKIECWIDKEKVVDLQYVRWEDDNGQKVKKERKITIRHECDLCRPLGVSTWCTTGAVRDIRIRSLTPETEKKPEAGTPPAKK
jgi:hypothetical protein